MFTAVNISWNWCIIIYLTNPITGLSGCSENCTTVNNISVNNLVHGSFQTFENIYVGFTATSGIAQSMKLHFILIDINKSISRSLINWQRTISQCYQILFVCHYDEWEMKFHCHCNLHFSSYEHGWIAFRVLKVLHFYFLQTILCSLFCRAWDFFFFTDLWSMETRLLSETWVAQFLHAGLGLHSGLLSASTEKPSPQSWHQHEQPGHHHGDPSIPACMRACVRVCICACSVAQSCRTLCNPWTVALQAILSLRLSLQEILEWVAISSSMGSSWPRDLNHIPSGSCISRWILYHQTTYNSHETYSLPGQAFFHSLGSPPTFCSPPKDSQVTPI